MIQLPCAIGVCGFGRCGSSMLMAMLDAGGVSPVDGTAPGTYETSLGASPKPGRSIKLLDAILRPGLPPDCPFPFCFVWLDRNPEQQARSQVKFADAMFPGLGGVDWKRFADSYGRDRPRALGLLRRAGAVLVMEYERILANPRQAATKLRRFLHPDFDVDSAAAVVHIRDGLCRPDLSIELALAGGVS